MKTKFLNELEIGDVVTLTNQERNVKIILEPYCQLTVINKTEKEITFFKPYVSLADFTYTGGVIPYIGVEKFSVPINNWQVYFIFGNIYHGKK